MSDGVRQTETRKMGVGMTLVCVWFGLTALVGIPLQMFSVRRAISSIELTLPGGINDSLGTLSLLKYAHILVIGLVFAFALVALVQHLHPASVKLGIFTALLNWPINQLVIGAENRMLTDVTINQTSFFGWELLDAIPSILTVLFLTFSTTVANRYNFHHSLNSPGSLQNVWLKLRGRN